MLFYNNHFQYVPWQPFYKLNPFPFDYSVVKLCLFNLLRKLFTEAELTDAMVMSVRSIL